MPIKINFKTWKQDIFFIVSVLIMIYMLCQISYMAGGIRVRKEIVVANPDQLQEYQDSVAISDSVLQMLINDQSDIKKECDQDILFWKGAYYQLKNKLDAHADKQNTAERSGNK